ncbi:MAG: molybdopterin biosynthesis protein, partial [Deltaproteobacteria bacterium]|nr:molybdopterin biosynthesis protein [Deltaproteobacteria bacterium]
MTSLAQARVLVVGCGGLAATRALVQAGLGALTLMDDDRVQASNLHRQTLFQAEDEGRLKVEAAAEALRALRPTLEVTSLAWRLLPTDAAERIAGHDLVLDGTDNLASKFLIADAARMAAVPAVHAGVVRWTGWALAAAGQRGPCMRCVFEDLPA